MTFARQFEQLFRRLLPTPFSIAVLLTLLTFGLAFFCTTSATGNTGLAHLYELSIYWQEGLWNNGLLVFAVQMMLILVLGHTLALAPPVYRLINFLSSRLSSPAKATALLALLSLVVALFNWGLSLVFGAVMARMIAQHFSEKQIPFNYGLLGAAGYSGMLIWHGGLSGSAPLKVVEKGHLQSLLPTSGYVLPDYISLEQTLFSSMNLTACLMMLVLLPLCLYFLAMRSNKRLHQLASPKANRSDTGLHQGAERLDYSKWFGKAIGLVILFFCVVNAFNALQNDTVFFTLNYINLLLLGICLSMHQSISGFLRVLDEAIVGASGILIQFPLYFGIMGLMQASGLLGDLSAFFSSVSTANSLPVYTFISAGLVNIFVPSGGGQWSIQGPMLIDACMQSGASLPKTIMAMAYGDQLTNMLQPFWALPLLGITGLKARDIIPFSFCMFLLGSVVYLSILLLF
jgi:short-chain fatty acids transporter